MVRTVFVVVISSLLAACAPEVATAQGSAQRADAGSSGAHFGFPDFGAMLPPAEHQGYVFRLSQDYPRERPSPDSGARKILDMDFREDWRAYAMAVRDYVFEGNIDQGAAGDYEAAFRLEENPVRSWFHVPWQHWGKQGREGFHGLTQEGPIAAQMLAPSQTSESHAYAVGFYNAPGGFVIGKLWPTTERPDLSFFEGEHPDGIFPVGTVVGKLLFTPLDEREVPFLADPIQWTAYAYASDLPGALNRKAAGDVRVRTKVQLIQMDIMVRDERAKGTGGWVFGTFVYNGKLGNGNRWQNLQPVGLMWGEDPFDVTSLVNPTPTETKTNPALKQTVINPDESMPPMHLGWGYRLNGPVDNPTSSCMSCHSTAQYPGVTAIMPILQEPKVPVPPEGTEAGLEWMRWFRNVDCGTPFDPGKAVSLDYSLQMQKSVQNWVEYMSQTQHGLYANEYWENGYKVRRNTFER